jgi:hypothetical protein
MQAEMRMIDDTHGAMTDAGNFSAQDFADGNATCIIDAHQYAAFGQIESLSAQRA